MGFFKMNAPRKFDQKYIYVDERREKLRKIEEKAKRDLGLLPPEEGTYEERIRGAFVNSTTHLKKRKEGGGLKTQTVLVCLLVAIFILHYLLTGSWSF